MGTMYPHTGHAMDTLIPDVRERSTGLKVRLMLNTEDSFWRLLNLS
jgi:hypothetical protein